MVTCLKQGKHRVVGYARTADLVKQAEKVGCVGATSLEDMVSKGKAPRAVWIMVPSGPPTEETVNDDVAGGQQGGRLVDGLFGRGAGGHHDPDGAGRFHLGDHVLERGSSDAADLKKKSLH